MQFHNKGHGFFTGTNYKFLYHWSSTQSPASLTTSNQFSTVPPDKVIFEKTVDT